MTIVTIGVLGVLGSCGDTAGARLSGDPLAVVHAAADRTIAAGSADVTVSVSVAPGPGLIGAGAADLTTGRADLVFKRTGSTAQRGGRFEVVTDGADAYLLVVAPGSAWLGGSLPDVARAAHAPAAPLDDLMVRPGAGLALAFLRGAKRVLPYGGEEIEGTSTLRYSFVVDLAAAIASSTPAQRPALEAAARAIGGVLEPADVWLDGAGRVRRLRWATDPRAHTTTTRPNFFTKEGEFLSFIVLDLSQFGTRVSIRLPNVADVTAVTPAPQ